MKQINKKVPENMFFKQTRRSLQGSGSPTSAISTNLVKDTRNETNNTNTMVIDRYPYMIPPPFLQQRYGKRQTLPRPTETEMQEKRKSSLLENVPRSASSSCGIRYQLGQQQQQLKQQHHHNFSYQQWMPLLCFCLFCLFHHLNSGFCLRSVDPKLNIRRLDCALFCLMMMIVMSTSSQWAGRQD